MNTRIASLLAAALIVATPMSSAFARGLVGYGHPGEDRAAVVVVPVEPDDVLTTGSIGGRGFDSSAKSGNANQPERDVPQFGNTSGGPAF